MFNKENKKIEEIAKMSNKYIDNLKIVESFKRSTSNTNICINVKNTDGTTLCYGVKPNDGELVKLITKFIQKENEEIKKALKNNKL